MHLWKKHFENGWVFAVLLQIAFHKEILSAAYNMKNKNEKHCNTDDSKPASKLVHKYLGQRM